MPGMLVLSRRRGESIRMEIDWKDLAALAARHGVSHEPLVIDVTLVNDPRDGRARLGFQAPAEVAIARTELLQAVPA